MAPKSFWIGGPVVVVAAALTPPLQADPVGKDLFDAHCADCHGLSATGDGPKAASIDGGVPNLTTLATRNGGTFPTIDVMSYIDGYTRENSYANMPAFGEQLLDAPTVLYDAGDGIPTPTPEPLVQVAEYLISIQN
ncbi:MAG: cytochrome c [Rhodobacteraceae bacterium]|nr:cytochrome c [Paracoccaceae bacterium]